MRGRMRTVALLLTALLALSGCTAGDAGPPGADPGPVGPRGRPGCRGVSAADVRGPGIGYAHGPLAAVPGSRSMCAAYWLPGADQRMVPQGLALDGGTAWVSGYHFSPEAGARRCVLTHVSLAPAAGSPASPRSRARSGSGTRRPAGTAAPWRSPPTACGSPRRCGCGCWTPTWSAPGATR